VYDDEFRREAVRAWLEGGMSLSAVSREFGASRSSIRSWQTTHREERDSCFACWDALPRAASGYSALLGFYLGDGCVSVYRKKVRLRISCDASYPGIIEDIADCISQMEPRGKTFLVPAPGAVVVASTWKHWLCHFPQHGPGRKHERPIVLEPWQREVVSAFPADFLRGLFHSDGCRAKNWTRRTVAGEMKRYDYPRWQFTNNSADIRGLCCWALDLVDVAWRQSNWQTISVSRRADVARLDELIGPKY
jgi:hypothetical protein